MKPGSKKITIAALVACFVAQTYLVYSDETASASLDPQGLRGAELWHSEACQTCHQIYGFGGFLGPDLTNTATELGASFDARLHFVLETGPGQMPEFDLDDEEVAAIGEFLRAMDRTGRGQAHAPVGESRGRPFEVAIEASFDAGTSMSIRRGFETYKSRPCQACHRAFEDVPDGPPDLSLAARRLSSQQLEDVLQHGRAPGMPVPRPAFNTEEREDVKDFFVWLAAERDTLKQWVPSDTAEFSFEALPWWEYRHE